MHILHFGSWKWMILRTFPTLNILRFLKLHLQIKNKPIWANGILLSPLQNTRLPQEAVSKMAYWSSSKRETWEASFCLAWKPVYTGPSCSVSTAENLLNCGALPKDTLERLKLKQTKANHSLSHFTKFNGEETNITVQSFPEVEYQVTWTETNSGLTFFFFPSK